MKERIRYLPSSISASLIATDALVNGSHLTLTMVTLAFIWEKNAALVTGTSVEVLLALHWVLPSETMAFPRMVRVPAVLPAAVTGPWRNALVDALCTTMRV